jgi:hypothetical protein
VRVFVKDPGDDLRLGMPATVVIALQSTGPATTPAPSPVAPVAPAAVAPEKH